VSSVGKASSVAEQNTGWSGTLENGSHEALGAFLLMLRARGFRDSALLNAIERAPRNEFLPLPYMGFAFQDMAIPLDCGQEAPSPLSIIETISALNVEPEHHVLEIGTGSGWQTAVLAGLCEAIVSVERYKTLADDADRKMQRLGLTNAVVAHGDGEGGLPAAAPFQRIIINAAIDCISPIIAAQLADDGLLIAPLIGEQGQRLTRFRKRGDQFLTTDLGLCRFAPLTLGTASIL
jgi:protein-L-isoaspartate(D-aspartate) O-methyltransferase